jgi:iron complex outermembrane receptor protein
VTSGTQPNTMPTPPPARSASARRAPPTATTCHLDLAWDAIPDKLTLSGGLDHKKYNFRHLRVPARQPERHDLRAPAGTSVASLTTTLTGFGKGLNLPAGTPTAWVIPNLNAIASAYDIYCNCLKSGPAGGPGDFTLSSTTNGNARGNNRKVVETDRAAS